ncbi:hypothetical protein Vadar_015244 [Vaccinium darrowii]|uniref:Uncharacterized protein n=1 Tax=Vaccinium darrowii TaxID=229202 RepID=A0ACB7Z4Y0_9ERIC|nr:hypothetical protein Vadar_015244 [Vaccinium darrowii]
MENNSTITFRQTLFPNPQRGRCICFRTVSCQQGRSISSSLHQIVISFYSIPFDFFGDGGGGDDVNSSNPHVEVLMPFCTSTDLSKSSTLSSIGSSLFFVGGEGFRTDVDFYRFDTAAPADGWSAMPMLATRAMPLTLVMDGKLYVFGGSPYAPLAELFDPSLTPSRFLPLHPPPSFLSNCNWLHLVIAPFQRSNKILVASMDVAIVYNVVDRVWEELDHKADFSCVRGQAAVFQNGTALCWCSRDAEEVHAYDLVLKRWFKSPIKGLDKIAYREPDFAFLYCPLLPLDDNHLCLIWQDRICYADTDLPLFHCSKIRVSIYTDAQGESRFVAVVVASRSALLGEVLERRMKAERGAVDRLVMTVVLGNVTVMVAVAELLQVLLPSRDDQSVCYQDIWKGTAKDIRLGTAIWSAEAEAEAEVEVGGMLLVVPAELVKPSYSKVARFAQ